MPRFIEEASKNPCLPLGKQLKFSKPELVNEVNRTSRSLNVTVPNVAQTWHFGMSGLRYDYVTMNVKLYEVFGEMKKPAATTQGPYRLVVRNNNGEMVADGYLVTKTEKSTTPHCSGSIVSAASIKCHVPRRYLLVRHCGHGLSGEKKAVDSFRRTSGQARDSREHLSNLFALLWHCCGLSGVPAHFVSFRTPDLPDDGSSAHSERSPRFGF